MLTTITELTELTVILKFKQSFKLILFLLLLDKVIIKVTYCIEIK